MRSEEDIIELADEGRPGEEEAGNRGVEPTVVMEVVMEVVTEAVGEEGMRYVRPLLPEALMGPPSVAGSE